MTIKNVDSVLPVQRKVKLVIIIFELQIDFRKSKNKTKNKNCYVVVCGVCVVPVCLVCVVVKIERFVAKGDQQFCMNHRVVKFITSFMVLLLKTSIAFCSVLMTGDLCSLLPDFRDFLCD